MLNKEELMACIDQVYDYGKKLIVMWNDCSMQQIRLRSANENRREESKQHNIAEMEEKRVLRFKLQKQANYEKWKNSPDYDPARDRNIRK